MAVIRPFRGLRYTKKAGDIASLACPPYDIVSEKERLSLLEENPYNMIRLELPEGDDPYAEAKAMLDRWAGDEILTHDEDEGIYIYEEEFLTRIDHGETKKLRGFICRVRLEDFSSKVILPHEETLSKAKEDRLKLMKSTFCNFSQIYSLYKDEGRVTGQRLDNLVSSAKPRYEFSDGLVTHRMWVINDRLAIKAIADDFADRKLYIADGHHRYETALSFRNYLRESGTYCPGAGYVMMMLVDMEHPGLEVFPTHRLIKGLENFDGERLIKDCGEYFYTEERDDITEIEAQLTELYRDNKKAFGYYGGGDSWVLLTLKDESIMDKVLPERSEAGRKLDVAILHSLILEKLLGIDSENMAGGLNLSYTRSAAEALDSVRNGGSQCAFIINPTKVSEIGAVADAGEKMPQKSTYFYPKIKTGLVMNDLRV